MGRRQCLFLRRSAAPSSRRHRDRKKGRLALSKRSSLFSSRASLFLLRAVLVVSASVSARVAEEFDSGVVASHRFFFCPSFFGRFWRFFDLAFSALFQRPRFFFVVFLLPKRFLRSTNELNKEGKDASHKTHHMESLFSFFVVFFFLLCVESDLFFQDLFLKEEKNLIIVKHSFAFFLTRQIKQARKARKKRPCCCFASSVLSPPHKKDIIPIRVKSPTTPCWRPQRERTRRQQTTTTTTTDDALWRKERRHFWTTTTTTTTEQQK